MPSRTVSLGIKGSIQHRLATDMLDVVGGAMKVLVVDAASLTVVNSCLRMHDLMDHGVTLVENVHSVRQPLPTSPAIYLLTPTRESVAAMLKDWEGKNMYREAHLFFLSASSDDLLRTVATSGAFTTKKIATVCDLLIDFSAPMSLLCSLNATFDLGNYFGAAAPLCEGKRTAAAAQLANVAATMGDRIVVRFQKSSTVATEMATMFARAHAEALRKLKKPPAAVAAEVRTTAMLIVDRRVDPVFPLLHDLHYATMLDDLAPLKGGVYEQTYTDRGGKAKTRALVLDENDETWCKYRHLHISHCLKRIPEELQALLKSNPQLASGMSKDSKLSDLGAAVRALPAFQEAQGKLSAHIDICEKLIGIYKSANINTVCELELMMTRGERANGQKASTKDIIDTMSRIAKDPSIRLDDKRRLLLIGEATQPAKDWAAQRPILARDSGVDPNDAAFAGMAVLSPPGTFRATSARSSSALIGDVTSNIATIVSGLAGDTLPTAEFPYMQPTDAAVVAQLKPTAGGARRPMGRVTAATRLAQSAQSDALTLDLGGNEEITLSSPLRFLVVIVGGVTHGESRGIYLSTRELKQELILCGTSIISAASYLQQLPSLA